MRPVAFWQSLVSKELSYLTPKERFTRGSELWKGMTTAQQQQIRDQAATTPSAFARNEAKRLAGYRNGMKRIMVTRIAPRLRNISPRNHPEVARVALQQLDAAQTTEMVTAARKLRRLKQLNAGNVEPREVSGHLAWAHKRARKLREVQGLSVAASVKAAMAEYSALPAKTRAAICDKSTPAAGMRLPKYITAALPPPAEKNKKKNKSAPVAVVDKRTAQAVTNLSRDVVLTQERLRAQSAADEAGIKLQAALVNKENAKKQKQTGAAKKKMVTKPSVQSTKKAGSTAAAGSTSNKSSSKLQALIADLKRDME